MHKQLCSRVLQPRSQGVPRLWQKQGLGGFNRPRYISSTPIHLSGRHHTRRDNIHSGKPNSIALYDDKIPARTVRIADPVTNSLGEPISRRAALYNINPATDRLVCVSKPPRYIDPDDPSYQEIAENYDYIVRTWQQAVKRFGQPEDTSDDVSIENVTKAPPIFVPLGNYIRLPSGEEWIPICKVENKAEAAARAKAAADARKEAKKLAPEGIKILEFNWAMAEGDLNHKLKKLQEFLQSRRKVEVVIAPKRRGKKASIEEAQALFSKVKACIASIPGAKETRSMEGQIGDVISVMVEGIRGKAALEASSTRSLQSEVKSADAPD